MNAIVNESIGDRIKRLRAARGFENPQQLGLTAGIDPNYLRRIEKGENTPGVAILKKLAFTLGCTLDELAGD